MGHIATKNGDVTAATQRFSPVGTVFRRIPLYIADVVVPSVVAHHLVAISDHPGAQLFHHNFYAALTAWHTFVPEHCYLHYFPSIACVVSLFAFNYSTNFAFVCINWQPFQVVDFLLSQSFRQTMQFAFRADSAVIACQEYLA